MKIKSLKFTYDCSRIFSHEYIIVNILDERIIRIRYLLIAGCLRGVEKDESLVVYLMSAFST